MIYSGTAIPLLGVEKSNPNKDSFAESICFICNNFIELRCVQKRKAKDYITNCQIKKNTINLTL